MMVSLRTILVSCLVVLASFCSVRVSAQDDFFRIINGSPTTVNVLPYVVQLRDTKQFCGGSLVSPKHVITAAHCFNSRPPQNVVIVGGATTVTETGVTRRIAKLFIHPEYSPATVHSDIAIIEMNQVMSGRNIKTVRLCRRPVVPGQFLQVSGWGRTAEANRQGSGSLRTVQLPVRRWDVCLNEFKQQVKKNMFCAAGLEAKGTCFGDSGGPAVYNDELCGIVAIGYKCGVVGRLSGFTNIFALRPYIASILGF